MGKSKKKPVVCDAPAVKPLTIKDARANQMRRVLLPLYREWVESGMPMRT